MTDKTVLQAIPSSTLAPPPIAPLPATLDTILEAVTSLKTELVAVKADVAEVRKESKATAEKVNLAVNTANQAYATSTATAKSVQDEAALAESVLAELTNVKGKLMSQDGDSADLRGKVLHLAGDVLSAVGKIEPMISKADGATNAAASVIASARKEVAQRPFWRAGTTLATVVSTVLLTHATAPPPPPPPPPPPVQIAPNPTPATSPASPKAPL